MLQLALLASIDNPSPALAAATHWLLAQVDPTSGQAPNYGHNDGALLLPLASGGFADQRPTAQAAARAFLGHAAYPPGPWDELSLWLGLPVENGPAPANDFAPPVTANPAIHRLDGGDSWAILRAERYTSRPAHADQLHLDLFWRGQPLALDAGTYRYNAAPPWDNTLARTRVHNTVQINDRDQMLRAGRFLWLDWAQARLVEHSDEHLTAEHDGYRRLGLLHRRTVRRAAAGQWRVEDHLLPLPAYHGRPVSFWLHWLLPDTAYHLEESTLHLTLASGDQASLCLHAPDTATGQCCLMRAGSVLAGSGPTDPTLGWYAPTYGQKIPALSFGLSGQGALPLVLRSDWQLFT